MILSETLAHQGRHLFRWRSFWPLLYLLLGVLALPEAVRVYEALGEGGSALIQLGGLTLALLGLSLRWAVIGHVPAGTSGRNTKRQVADELNVTGFYSVTRNPLYLGNLVALVGVLLATGVWWLAAVVLLVQALCLERIVAVEERFLLDRFGARYRAYADRVPALLPRPSLWRPWALPFSARNVLRREFYGVLAVVSAIAGWDLLVDVAWRGEPIGSWLANDRWLLVTWLVALALFAVLRLLKKRTRLLAVAGR